MNITHKSDYALRALLTLTTQYKQGPISVTDLAKRSQMPRPYLEKIMFELRAQGWVKSVRGRTGGFELALSPEKITMGEIVRHFDGPLAPTMRTEIPAEHIGDEAVTARFRTLLGDIRAYSYQRLDEATLALLAPPPGCPRA